MRRDTLKQNIHSNTNTNTHMNVITIDGTCFTDKSTTAGFVSTMLDFKHLNTGLAYRGLALLNRNHESVDLQRISMTDSGITIDNEPIPIEDLKNPEMDRTTSSLSKIDNFQKMSRQIIRDYADRLLETRVPGLIVEGRNAGTFLFPDASLKIWLFTDQQTRMRRAVYEASKSEGSTPNNKVMADMLVRDFKDFNRPCAPLAKPKGAIEIDTSAVAPEFVGKVITEIWNELCA